MHRVLSLCHTFINSMLLYHIYKCMFLQSHMILWNLSIPFVGKENTKEKRKKRCEVTRHCKFKSPYNMNFVWFTSIRNFHGLFSLTSSIFSATSTTIPHIDYPVYLFFYVFVWNFFENFFISFEFPVPPLVNAKMANPVFSNSVKL